MDVSKRNVRRLMAIVMVFMLMFSTVGSAFAVELDSAGAGARETTSNATFDAHVATDFGTDGVCTKHVANSESGTEACGYSLTDFQSDCPAASLHTNLLKDEECGLCGYVGEAEHDAGHTTFSEYNTTNANDSVHWKVCSEDGCEVVTGIEAHTWSEGTCSVCRMECSNMANHGDILVGDTCDVCGIDGTKEAHEAIFASHTKDSFNTDGSCKTVGCGYTLTKFQEDCTVDHSTIATTSTCDTCGAAGTKTESGAHKHEWTAAWDMNTTHHWHNCTADGCDVTENADKNAYGAHDWSAKDGICVTCKMYCPNKDNHPTVDNPGTCSTCGFEVAAHTQDSVHAFADFEKNADGKIICKLGCGKEITVAEYQALHENHDWTEEDGVCVDCGAACPNTDGHANILNTEKCLTCGAAGTLDPADHTHDNWATEWSHDETSHWHACQEAGCEVKSDVAAHDWSDADGVCTVCEMACPNTDNHGDILTGETCDICGIAGAKTPAAHPDGYVHVFADFEKKADGTIVCKTAGCGETITLVEYQQLHGTHTWAADKSGVCDVCGIACPNTSKHSNIVAGETCETCGFVGTKHVHHWTDGVCDGAGICPGCSLSDSHATILKGEVCEECGYIGTYVAPVTAVMNVTTTTDPETGSLTAAPEGNAVTSAIDTARSGDGVSPVAPVNLVINMTDPEGQNGAATLTLAAATVTALVEAQTVEVEDSEGNTESVSAPVTLVVMNMAGAVALPMEAVTMAQDSDATASVVVDLASVTTSELKDQLTVTQEGGQDVYKDDQGEVVDVDNAVALDVTLSKNDTEATITGLDNEIMITMKAPDGAKGVKVYYVDEANDILKLVKASVLVDSEGNVTFGVDHLTTFVIVETHVHDWNNGVCANQPCPGCPDAANHENILTTQSCPTCGLPGTKHTEERDAHNLDSFNEDGSCKTDGCHYTLTQFQESCPLAATHANLLTTQTCEECGFVGTGHNNTFAAHDKDSFNADGSCKHDDCDYTLAQFQTDCNANGGNHADILTSATCPICGAAGTKTSGGGSSGGSSSGSGSKPVTPQNPDTTTTTDPNTGATTVTTKNPDGSSVVTITQKDGTKTTTNTDANGKVETTVELKTTTIEAAAGDPVKLPMNTVAVTKSESSAETVTVKTENGNNVTVAIPASGVTAGTVAMVMGPDGTYSVMKDSLVVGNTVVATVANGATVKLVDRGMTFADMAGHWATDAVAFATARDLFNGTSATTFSPNAPMTRAMVVTVLARYDGVNTDGGSTWYAKGVEWAMSKGVSDGTNPTADITREQLVTMLWRFVGEPGSGANLSGYTDAGQVSSYATNAMRWAVENGVIKGRTSTTLAPKGQATRAEVAQIFQNLLSIAN